MIQTVPKAKSDANQSSRRNKGGSGAAGTAGDGRAGAALAGFFFSFEALDLFIARDGTLDGHRKGETCMKEGSKSRRVGGSFKNARGHDKSVVPAPGRYQSIGRWSWRGRGCLATGKSW